MILLRISIGLFFLRIFHTRTRRNAIYGVLVFYSLFSFGYFWFAIFQCGIPRGKHFWELKVSGCGGTSKSGALAVGYIFAICTAGADLLFWVLSLPLVIGSQITIREKTIISGILAIAIVGCAGTILRSLLSVWPLNSNLCEFGLHTMSVSITPTYKKY
jgi:hypothetical protein